MDIKSEKEGDVSFSNFPYSLSVPFRAISYSLRICFSFAMGIGNSYKMADHKIFI